MPPKAPQVDGWLPHQTKRAGGGASPGAPPEYKYNPNGGTSNTAYYGDGDYTSTRVPASSNVTHINLWNNDVRTISLANRSRLERLTLSSNDLRSLSGISAARNLVYLDVSNNDLTSLNGLHSMSKLEWVNAADNDIKDISSLRNLPSLYVLDLYNNDLENLHGIGILGSLEVLHAENNDLIVLRGLEHCKNLRRVNIAKNNLKDITTVLSLTQLPYLRELNVSDNLFSKADLAELLRLFSHRAPNCKVITNRPFNRAGW